MKKNKLITKLVLAMCFAMLFGLAKFFGKNVSYFDLLFFSLGLFLGSVLLELDEKYFFKYYSQDSGNLANSEDKKNNANDVDKVGDIEKVLITRSLLFILSLLPLGIFLLTSTGSALGVGIFLGILSTLSYEFYLFKNDLHIFKNRFMHQLKRDISPDEHQLFTTIFISVSILYGFFVIFLGK